LAGYQFFSEDRAVQTIRRNKFRLKRAWGERDCEVILNVVRQMPENTLQEEPRLLIWYDQALVRMEGD
jgi:hypothetical protein